MKEYSVIHHVREEHALHFSDFLLDAFVMKGLTDKAVIRVTALFIVVI